MCKYEKGHQITSAFTDGAVQKGAYKHSSQRLKRSIDFLGAERVKMTSLAHGSPRSSTRDLSNKEQSQERQTDGAGKRNKEEGVVRSPKAFPPLQGRAGPISSGKPEPGFVLRLLWLAATSGDPALCLQESSGKGRAAGGPVTLAVKDFSGRFTCSCKCTVYPENTGRHARQDRDDIAWLL